MSKEIYAKLAARLSEIENLIITGHVDPDSDCVGSILGIYDAFDGAAKGWQMVLEDDIPDYIKFLPGVEAIIKPEEIKNPGGFLLIDCGEAQRAGDWLPPLWGQMPSFIIDHHEGQPDEAEMTLWEPETAASGELCLRVALAGGQKLGSEAALCFYSAIAGDTGSFRFVNTSPDTHMAAAKLLEIGVDIEEVRNHLYGNFSHANVQMLAAALSGVEYHHEGKICIMALTLADKERYQAQRSDLSNIVNYTLITRGVKVGMLLEEFPNYVKASLRCFRGYRVNQLAAAFGGGGHAQAAGCRLEGSLEEAKARLLAGAQELIFGALRV